MASFWDDFKDIFKTKSQKEEEKDRELKGALDKENDLVKQLEALEKEYKAAHPDREFPSADELFPKESGYKEIEYVPVSDEDIEKRAEDAIAYGKQSALDSLTERYDKETEKSEKSRQDADKSLEEDYKKLSELYEELKKKTENDAIKRGMARSSTAAGQLEDLEYAKAAGAQEIRKEYESAVAAADAQIEKLRSDRENALQQLDLKYAEELNKQIASLKKDRSSAVEKLERYNNKVREKDVEYNITREENVTDYLSKQDKARRKAEAEQAEYEKKYGYSGDKLQNYAKRYELAYDFYTALSPEVAADALQASPNMKYYLGNYYDKLLSILKSNAGENVKIYF